MSAPQQVKPGDGHQGSRKNVLVAVIDSGWLRGRNDPRVLSGFGLVGRVDESHLEISDNVDDSHGHGTICAAVVLQMAPKARILPIRVFGRRLETSVQHVVEALRIACKHKVDVVSMSLATDEADSVKPLYLATFEASQAGAIVVASAKRGASYSYPAVFEHVIGVEGAPDLESAAVRFRAEAAVEFAACGMTPGIPESQRQLNNSVAAARVAGLVAKFRAQRPAATCAEAREWLADRARPRGAVWLRAAAGGE